MPGCRGRSPRRNKLLVSPFPTGEGGWGDRGQKRKLKAGAAGDKEGKPPIAFSTAAGIASAARGQAPHCAFHSGRDSQCRAGSAPIAFSTAAGIASAARGQAPLGHLFGWFCKCRLRFSRGDARGEAPCIRKQKISPFPGGEGGMGAENQAKGGVGGRQRKQAPPSGTTVAGIASAARGQAPPQGNAAAKSAGTARGTLSPPPLQEPSSVTTAPYAMQIPG